jgi:hypothetical protein
VGTGVALLEETGTAAEAASPQRWAELLELLGRDAPEEDASGQEGERFHQRSTDEPRCLHRRADPILLGRLVPQALGLGARSRPLSRRSVNRIVD